MNKWNFKKRSFILIFISMFLIEVILGIIYGVTKNKQLLYPMGFLFGILITYAIVILLLIFMKQKRQVVQFDERQLKNRGDCFCISFFVLIGCLFLDGMIRTIIEYDWSTYMIGIFTCIVISIAVFAILAIWKDAYTTTDDSKVRLIIISFLLSIINFVISIIQIVQYGFLENGKIGLSFLNILTGGLLMIVCVNLFVKYRIDKRKDFEDEELKTEIC